jgi:alcohol dehydrogenase
VKAALFDRFGEPLTVREVPDPIPELDGAVIQVEASGICRSDWYGWQGHDPDIRSLPHVPGHELAGIVVAVGPDVTNWIPGDRVTVPFCCGCGTCVQCQAGSQHICDNYFTPGFTAWGSFAQFVAIRYADTNLVRLPTSLDFVAAASLGCRFVTSFRALVAQGRVAPGQWVAVFGCGGVGLAAIMISRALGAHAVGIDIDSEKLDLAATLGAEETINATQVDDPAIRVIEVTDGGAHIAIDALGGSSTLQGGIRSLRKRGRHVQVGLICGENADRSIPVNLMIARELEIVGSHGMQAHEYPSLLEMIADGRLDPGLLVGRTISLEEAGAELESMGRFKNSGITVIDTF